MKKIIFVFLLGIFCVTFSSAQIIFQKVYIDNYYMQGSQWATTCKNGGYAFITNVFTVVRTNEYGDTIWCKNFQTNEPVSEGRLIEHTTDNGFIVIGEAGMGDGSPLDVILLKLDSNGNTIWCKAFDQGDWYPTTVKQTEDGGYILSFRSATSGAASIVKTDQNGNVVWSKEVSFGIGVDLFDVCKTSDGGYILAGEAFSSSTKILLLRLDSVGDFIWSKSYGGGTEKGNKVIQTTDGGFVVLGNSSTGFQSNSLYVIKTNGSGSLTWAKNYGAINNMYDGFGIVALNDNGCAIISSMKHDSSQYGGPSLIRIDENGDTLWTKTYTTGTSGGSVKSLSLTDDNGFLIGSHFSGHNGDLGFYLIKTDSTGYSGCNEIHLDVSNISLPLYQQNIVLQISIGIQTHTESISTSAASCFIVSCPFDNSILEIKNESNFIISPNPATNEIKISNLSPEENQIKIFNLLGQQVKNISVSNEQNHIINISDLPSGIYMLTVSNNKKISCKKFVKE